jgi:hypothetical protein
LSTVGCIPNESPIIFQHNYQEKRVTSYTYGRIRFHKLTRRKLLNESRTGLTFNVDGDFVGVFTGVVGSGFDSTEFSVVVTALTSLEDDWRARIFIGFAVMLLLEVGLEGMPPKEGLLVASGLSEGWRR